MKRFLETRFPSKPHWRDQRNTSECFLAKNSTRHTATSSDVNIKQRDSETFQLFNHLLLREDGEVPKTPIGLGLRTRGTIWDSYKNRPFPRDLGDVSFWVPYPFQRHQKFPLATWHLPPQKCDSRTTSSFCVAFGRFGSFLTSTFPALKHHQPCTLLQSASQLQLSTGAFGKTKLQTLLVHVSESRLMSMDGATQIPISEFEANRWHDSRVCVW